MEIQKMNIVGYYSYKPDIVIKEYDEKLLDDNKDIKCNICLRSIYDPSYETITNNNNIFNNNNIELGKCGHLFHSDCIKTWLKNNIICPVDKVCWHKHRTINTRAINKNNNKNNKNNNEIINENDNENNNENNNENDNENDN